MWRRRSRLSRHIQSGLWSRTLSFAHMMQVTQSPFGPTQRHAGTSLLRTRVVMRSTHAPELSARIHCAFPIATVSCTEARGNFSRRRPSIVGGRAVDSSAEACLVGAPAKAASDASEAWRRVRERHRVVHGVVRGVRRRSSCGGAGMLPQARTHPGLWMHATPLGERAGQGEHGP